MNERDVPFLNELRAELRRAAQQASGKTARRWLPTATLARFAAPALVAFAVLAFVAVGLDHGSKHRPPVRDYQSSTGYQPQSKTEFVGSKVCVTMYTHRHLPPLIHSQAAPDAALTSELSLLRQPSAPIDSTPLGSWDRFPLMISTIYQRYVRVVDGPRGVRLAIMPVDYCVQMTASSPANNPLQTAVHVTLEQGLVMLVLSDRGEHPPVLIGDAHTIKTGPALVGLDLDNASGEETGWLQTIVVPDGVAKVVMKFTPPFLHHYSNTVEIASNVGIVVRRPPYTPTTVLEYDAAGRVVKRWVDHTAIAEDSCLRHHGKTCFGGPAISNAKRYAIPVTAPADPHAKALYAPIIAYARATTIAQRAKSGAAATRVGGAMDACDRPYQKQLFSGIVGNSKNETMQRRIALYTLWNHVSAMQTYQADVAPLARQLRQLVASWAHLSAGTKLMNGFAHAVATELNASLTDPKINGCGFVRAVAAHHFSYVWARNSSYGKLATGWWRTVSDAGERTAEFTRFVQPPGFGRSGGAGQHLFTTGELSGLFNLPGELS